MTLALHVSRLGPDTSGLVNISGLLSDLGGRVYSVPQTLVCRLLASAPTTPFRNSRFLFTELRRSVFIPVYNGTNIIILYSHYGPFPVLRSIVELVLLTENPAAEARRQVNVLLVLCAVHRLRLFLHTQPIHRCHYWAVQRAEEKGAIYNLN